MPQRAGSACRWPGCPQLAVARGWCQRHDPGPWSGKHDPVRQPIDRKAVLARDGWRCRRCGRPASRVDHIVPRALGGSDHPNNLQSLCQPCHDEPRQGGQVSGAVRRAMRQPRRRT